MKKGFFLGICLIAVFVLILAVFRPNLPYFKGLKGKYNNTNAVSGNKSSKAVSPEEYRKQAAKLWTDYKESGSMPEKARIQALENIEKELLDLVVEPDFKNSHLDFAIGISLLQEGLKKDDKGLTLRGEKRLEKFERENKWLSTQ